MEISNGALGIIIVAIIAIATITAPLGIMKFIGSVSMRREATDLANRLFTDLCNPRITRSTHILDDTEWTILPSDTEGKKVFFDQFCITFKITESEGTKSIDVQMEDNTSRSTRILYKRSANVLIN